MAMSIKCSSSPFFGIYYLKIKPIYLVLALVSVNMYLYFLVSASLTGCGYRCFHCIRTTYVMVTTQRSVVQCTETVALAFNL